jgi:hypothetical protein
VHTATDAGGWLPPNNESQTGAPAPTAVVLASMIFGPPPSRRAKGVAGRVHAHTAQRATLFVEWRLRRQCIGGMARGVHESRRLPGYGMDGKGNALVQGYVPAVIAREVSRL